MRGGYLALLVILGILVAATPAGAQSDGEWRVEVVQPLDEIARNLAGTAGYFAAPSEPLSESGTPSAYPVAAAWTPDGSQLLVLIRHTARPDESELIPVTEGDLGGNVLTCI